MITHTHAHSREFVGFCGAFLKIIVVFFFPLRGDDGIWIRSLSLGVWESIVSLRMLTWRGGEMFSQHHITLIAHFIRNE